MKYVGWLMFGLVVIGGVFHADAQVTNLTVNGYSSNFAVVQGDSLEWQYNFPVGGSAIAEAWYDVNGNGLIDSSIDFQPFDLGIETDGAVGQGGGAGRDGLVNG